MDGGPSRPARGGVAAVLLLVGGFSAASASPRISLSTGPPPWEWWNGSPPRTPKAVLDHAAALRRSGLPSRFDERLQSLAGMLDAGLEPVEVQAEALALSLLRHDRGAVPVTPGTADPGAWGPGAALETTGGGFSMLREEAEWQRVVAGPEGGRVVRFRVRLPSGWDILRAELRAEQEARLRRPSWLNWILDRLPSRLPEGPSFPPHVTAEEAAIRPGAAKALFMTAALILAARLEEVPESLHRMGPYESLRFSEHAGIVHCELFAGKEAGPRSVGECAGDGKSLAIDRLLDAALASCDFQPLRPRPEDVAWVRDRIARRPEPWIEGSRAALCRALCVDR